MPSRELGRTREAEAADGRAPHLGIAIVSWNVRDLLHRCLETVRAAEGGGAAHVVVVDNASTDGTVDMVRTRFPDVTLIANRDNLGFSRANNQALTALGVLPGPDAIEGASGAADRVLLLNPDTEVAPKALVALGAVLADHPACACVGPLLRFGDGTIQSSRRRFPTVAVGLLESTPFEWHWPGNAVARRYRMDDVAPTLPLRVDWVVGAAMMLRGAALREVGGLDESYFMYSEELDLCRRLTDAGWHVRFEPAAEIVHHEGRSSEQVVAARHLRFMRSRVRYFRKHHGAVAAAVVRFGILGMYVAEIKIESIKWLVGHKREERAARVRAYWAILRDGLD